MCLRQCTNLFSSWWTAVGVAPRPTPGRVRRTPTTAPTPRSRRIIPMFRKSVSAVLAGAAPSAAPGLSRLLPVQTSSRFPLSHGVHWKSRLAFECFPVKFFPIFQSVSMLLHLSQVLPVAVAFWEDSALPYPRTPPPPTPSSASPKGLRCDNMAQPVGNQFGAATFCVV